jgi:hypothetical protein
MDDTSKQKPFMKLTSKQKPIVISILINILLPFLIKPFASDIQITPPNGAASLEFFGQLMHMFVHHAQVPIASSLIVAIIVAASNYLAKYI